MFFSLHEHGDCVLYGSQGRSFGEGYCLDCVARRGHALSHSEIARVRMAVVVNRKF